MPELLDALRRRWLVALLVAVPLLAGVVTYAQLLGDRYQAEAVVAFSPRPEVNIGGDTIRIVLPQYVAAVTSAATVRQVAQQTGLNSHTLGAGLDASIQADTTNLVIRVELSNPQQAADAASALADTVTTSAAADKLLTAAVVSPAIAPRGPSGPRRKLIDAVGLLLALILGALAAVLVERGRPRIRHVEDIVKLTSHPVVGRIPPSRSARDPVAALNDPAFGTGVRNLRLYLDAELRSQPLQTLAVTSPGVGDGKTTISIALAAAVARLDAKVLLVDADLRRPRVASALNLPVERTLGDVLTGRLRLMECVQAGPVPGLSVVTGNVVDEAGDLLPRGFADVMGEARQHFDVVVVDCPPLLGSEDATTVTSLVNGCLVVVSTGSAAKAVHQANLVLEALPVRVLGFVLNRSRNLASGYTAAYAARRS